MHGCFQSSPFGDWIQRRHVDGVEGLLDVVLVVRGGEEEGDGRQAQAGRGRF